MEHSWPCTMYLFLTADHKIRPNDFKDGVARSINADRVLAKIMKEFNVSACKA